MKKVRPPTYPATGNSSQSTRGIQLREQTVTESCLTKSDYLTDRSLLGTKWRVYIHFVNLTRFSNLSGFFPFHWVWTALIKWSVEKEGNGYFYPYSICRITLFIKPYHKFSCFWILSIFSEVCLLHWLISICSHFHNQDMVQLLQKKWLILLSYLLLIAKVQ